MNLPPPSIETRAEFEEKLLEAMDQANQQLQRTPDWPPMQAVANQLDVMRGWTENMRTPTTEERAKINIGLIALREFDDIEPLASLCHDLNHFFQDWPLASNQ